MTIAFVMVNVQPGAEEEILEKAKTFENVTEAYVVYGIYDLMVKIESDSLEKIKEIVDTKLRKLEKVRSSITMIVIGKYASE